MRRIRKTKKTESVKEFKSHILDTRGKMIGAIAAGAVILVTAFILMIVESGYGRITITNNTELNLEYIKTSFVDSESNHIDLGRIETVNAKENYSEALPAVNLVYTESNLEVRFKFADHEELFTNAGYFLSNFDGNIKITFDKTEDPNLLSLKIKASNGIFRTNTVDCNVTLLVNLADGKIYE